MLQSELKEYVLKNKEHRENVHNGRYFFPFLTEKVHYHVCDNTDTNTLGDAVEEGHCNNAKICGDCGCIVVGG